MKKTIFIAALTILSVAGCQNYDLSDVSFGEAPEEEVAVRDISPDEALSNLKAFLGGMGLQTKAAGISAEDLVPIKGEILLGTKAWTKAKAPAVLAYAVPFSTVDESMSIEDRGCAILGGTTAIEPVICVLDKGNISAEALTQAIVDLANEEPEEVDRATYNLYFAEKDNDADEDKIEDTELFGKCMLQVINEEVCCGIAASCVLGGGGGGRSSNKKYGPYLTTEWHQDKPFNRYATNEGSDQYAGCTIIALMQVLAYNEKPSVKEIYDGGNDFVNNWKNIKFCPAYRGVNFTWEQAFQIDEEVARIAQVLGDKDHCKAKYLDYGTAASVWHAKNVMNKYGYKATFHYGCNNADQDRIDKQLRAGRPVLMGGKPKDPKQGHTWVVDGLYDGCYHVNWGFGGSNNGWFAKGSFDMSNGKFDVDSAWYNSVKFNYYQYFRYVLY